MRATGRARAPPHSTPPFPLTPLAGLRVSAIENLAITQDAYDAIDLSDNSILLFENFPRMHRLRMLLLNNNRIAKFERGVGEQLPSLETLVLTNNRLASLTDVAELGSFMSLESVSLLGNPVTRKLNYRLFVIHTCKRLRLLDFARVRDKERAEAAALFKSKKGKAFLAELAQEGQHAAPSSSAAAAPGSSAAAAAPVRPSATLLAAPVQTGSGPVLLDAELAARFQEAVAQATTAEEVDRLKHAHDTGGLGALLQAQTSGSGAEAPDDTVMTDA